MRNRHLSRANHIDPIQVRPHEEVVIQRIIRARRRDRELADIPVHTLRLVERERVGRRRREVGHDDLKGPPVSSSLERFSVESIELA